MNRNKITPNAIPIRMTGIEILIICSTLYEGFIVVELVEDIFLTRSNETKSLSILFEILLLRVEMGKSGV
jgi:hypothetical protein